MCNVTLDSWIEQQKADKAENYFQAGCLYAMCVADDKTNLDECVVAAIGSIEKRARQATSTNPNCS